MLGRDLLPVEPLFFETIVIVKRREKVWNKGKKLDARNVVAVAVRWWGVTSGVRLQYENLYVL